MNKLKPLLALLLLGISSVVSAALTSGYYRIKSNCYDGRYIAENVSSQTLATTAKAESNYAQVWDLSVSGSNVTIRNVLTDRYVQSQTQPSAYYATGVSDYPFTYSESDGVVNFKNTNWGGLHCSASQSYNVVYWDNTADANKWVLEAATIDNAALQAQKDASAEASSSQLTQFFTSTACTALNSSYANSSDASLRNAMSSLPATVRDMAVKVKNNAWTTYAGWDKTERTFRIADYKAYSNGDRWTSILGYGHKVGRLSNPTGIWADADDYLYVYVGPIPNGQIVKLEVVAFGQASGSLYNLHEGMNALLMSSAGNCFVFYEVDNTTNGTAPFTPLISYADVTVHIEGGTVQGYFDMTKGDDADDWSQLNTHLLTKEAVCLKSSKHVMNLYKEWLLTALGTESVTEMMTVWENLSKWEDELTGRSDAQGQNTYGQYCNNVSSVTSLPGNGSPHATNYGTYYYDYSHNKIFNANALLTVADNLWCIAHEQGHNRQKPINMVGNTEISNNLFSNVAVYMQGRYTSRTASIQMTFRDFQDGLSWPERVRKSCANESNYNQQMIHLNWQLYLFFHVNGNDPDFFPRLYDALRADPLTATAGTDHLTPASTDYLKYYVKCCEVSGYDLTEFFEAYGFFLLPPEQETSKTDNGVTTNRYQTIGDYSTYNLYVTQDMINAAKTAVANMSGLKPCNIIFIEDRVKAPLATYEGHAEGEQKTINPDAPVGAFGAVGEMGQYTDFDVTPSAYTFNVSERGTVKTAGTGAVGFKVYDGSGNLVGFYNTTTFTLPSGLTDYTIKAAAGDGTDAVVARDATIEVSDFPKTDTWYVFCSTLRGSRFVLSNGAGQGVDGAEASVPSESMQWRFALRDGETEVFDIVNRDNSYLDPSAANNTQITTSSSQPSAGWKIVPAATAGMYIIYSGSAQLNQTNNAGTNGNKVYNWGGGSNTGDAGCQFSIEEIREVSTTPLDEFAGFNIIVSEHPSNDLVPGRWYVMFDRGTASGPHGYLFEKSSSQTLYNTNVVPSGTATDNAKYLVRLVEAPDGKYFIQTGYGNYFWDFKSSVNVATSAYAISRITVAKIAGTDGHFYLQSANNNVILDANVIVNTDNTVVGYGTTVPTEINGNNDWAFYPVELVYPVKLNAVGDASYATFFSNRDMQAADGTKAYYISTVSDGYAQLIELSDGQIPARTAVVLVNSSKAANSALTPTSGLTAVVSESDNLLKGTLEPVTLDLSDATNYYSLGQKGGRVGFYKFDKNGTTTITLGANKAYLDTTTPAVSNVKGFAFSFDDDIATGIGKLEHGSLNMEHSAIYNLSGQRLSKMQKGINIANGKKVIVR